MDANSSAIAPRFVYEFIARDAEGNIKWTEQVENLVTTAGRNDIISKYFSGSSYTAAWYLGLKGTGTIAAGDTMASHAGWAEVTGYSASTLPQLTFGAPSSGSSTATAITYSINATVTVAGAFITSNNAKGATTGVLYSASDFAASRSLVSGDSLQVTATVSFT